MKMDKVKLSIVVPCYNEEQNIPLILEGFQNTINRDDIEIILVNNGSTDGSQKVFNELLPRFSFAHLVNVEVNQGYGFGILSGLKEAQGEYIGWTHADMQTHPQDVIKALEIIEQKGNPEKIYVKGKRKNRPLFDIFFTVGMSFFETVLMQTPLWDINAQPNVFHRCLFEQGKNPPNDFSLDLYAYYCAKKQNFEIVRFDVIFPPRIYGTSHWNTSLLAKYKFIKRTLEFSFNLKKGFKND